MVKIAFCDDELSVLDELKVLTDKYCIERSKKIEYDSFSNPF